MIEIGNRENHYGPSEKATAFMTTRYMKLQAVADMAARLFRPLFDRAFPEIEIAGHEISGRYLQVRSLPIVKFSSSERGAGLGCVAEAQNGDLALEVFVCKGTVQTGEGQLTRWDTKFRAPDWRLIAVSVELF